MTTIVIVGCGGTGSALFQDLARSNFVTRKDIQVVLIDGDVVEKKNIGRQYFSLGQIGMNKAEALANTASKVLNLKNIYYVNQYLDSKTILDDILPFSRTTILVGCVDNHPARTLLEEFFYNKGNYSRKIYYIDCANELTTGEVVAAYNDRCEIEGLCRSKYDPSVNYEKNGEKSNDENNIASCSEEIDKGQEQTLIANRKSAIICLELISNYLKGNIQIGICYFKESVIKRVKRVGN